MQSYNFTKDNIKKINKKVSGVYEIRNTLNNKTYYGSSKCIKQRLTSHYSCLSRNKHANVILQNAWNKYGEENFTFRIVETCEPIRDTLLFIEQKYLDLKPEYNINQFASGSDIGEYKKEHSVYRNHSVQALDINTYKIALTFNNIVEANLYFNKAEFNPCIVQSINSYGKNLAYGYIWKFQNQDINLFKNRYIPKKKSIIKYDLQGNFIQEYNSVKSAAESINQKKNFQRDLRKNNFVWKGYIWKYKEYDKQ